MIVSLKRFHRKFSPLSVMTGLLWGNISSHVAKILRFEDRRGLWEILWLLDGTSKDSDDELVIGTWVLTSEEFVVASKSTSELIFLLEIRFLGAPSQTQTLSSFEPPYTENLISLRKQFEFGAIKYIWQRHFSIPYTCLSLGSTVATRTEQKLET